MNNQNAQVILYILAFGVFGYFFISRAKSLKVKKKPVGVSEKMLREPGHSLAIKSESENERILLLLVFSFFVPLIFIVGNNSSLEWYLIIPLLLLIAAFCGWLVSSRVLKLRDLYLGLQGERLVGEMLAWLMKDGFDVYHDYPIDPNGKSGNIDHIVVGPNGVFSIETKTVRKPTDDEKKENYIVKYDGEYLQYPHFKTKNGGIKQSINNGKYLSKELSSSVDEHIQVFPVLTLPGWFVESNSSTPLMVLNPKNIRSNILKKDPILSESLQRQIAHRIKERCKDVSF